MNNDLKIKILGQDISDLFLVFLLPKKGFKVEVFKKNIIFLKDWTLNPILKIKKTRNKPDIYSTIIFIF